ncbi:hypothetical protein FRC09_008405 [Ceratobasidium sp. 395]|nr:hypothetical protein FRC09_008405 [Ceratobasidium sp. 395]
MSEQYSKWGPKFNHYIKDSSAREEKAFSDYLESREITSVAHGGLLPLSILETMLVIGKNIDQTSYQRRGTFLPVLLTTLRQYKELNPSSHVIHTICIAILMEMDVLEDLVENRCRGPCCAAWGFIQALADRALYFITQTPLSTNLARVPTYFGVESLGMDIFPRVGGLSSEDLDFLLMTLWNDRCRLTTLIKRRMLPGLSALLFTTGHMMLYLGASRSAERWVPLQDLISRLILFGSQHILEERRLLQFVWAQRMDLGLMQDTSCVDEKDSRAVVRAYIDMFRPSSNEDRRSLLDTMWMEPSSILFQFACSHASTMAPNLLLEIQLVAIERLWLELDEERSGHTTVSQSYEIITYVLDILQVMW